MSQENVEIVREHIEAFRRGDPPGALSYLDPYVVWDPSRVSDIDVTVAYGHEEFSQTIRQQGGSGTSGSSGSSPTSSSSGSSDTSGSSGSGSGSATTTTSSDGHGGGGGSDDASGGSGDGSN